MAGTPDVAAVLEARRDELVDAGLAASRARVDAYRDADPALLADVRVHIATHHDTLCAVLRRGTPAEPDELGFVTRHAAMRARRGIAFADFLTAFRAYNFVLWDAIWETARERAGLAEEALEAARAASRYIDVATTVAGEAYLESQQLLLADRDRARRDLLGDLLAGRPPDAAAGLAVARDCGLEGDVRCVLVAALPTREPDDEGALLVAARALADALGRAGKPPLTVVRRGEIVIVRALGRDARPAPAVALERARRRLERNQGLTLGVGVSTVHDGLAGLPGAYREASLALGRVAVAGGVLSLADLSPFEYLTLRHSDVAQRLVAPEVERFVREDLAAGGMLTRTLLTYVATDLNVKAAAEELLVHVNTAHHRLGRIEEKTGRDLRRFGDVVDLVIAIRLAEAPA